MAIGQLAPPVADQNTPRCHTKPPSRESNSKSSGQNQSLHMNKSLGFFLIDHWVSGSGPLPAPRRVGFMQLLVCHRAPRGKGTGRRSSEIVTGFAAKVSIDNMAPDLNDADVHRLCSNYGAPRDAVL